MKLFIIIFIRTLIQILNLGIQCVINEQQIFAVYCSVTGF